MQNVILVNDFGARIYADKSIVLSALSKYPPEFKLIADDGAICIPFNPWADMMIRDVDAKIKLTMYIEESCVYNVLNRRAMYEWDN